jgi:hypothetical protein
VLRKVEAKHEVDAKLETFSTSTSSMFRELR